MNSPAISIDAASAITSLSRSTWWRRISTQAVTRAADDRGRTMLLWSEVAPHVDIFMDAENHETLFLADIGYADAQNTIGQFFLSAEKHKSAIYWFQLASKQDHPDAMQWLGDCYVCGKGVEKNEYLGLMWIAKAAVLGHVIAQEQLNELLGRAPVSLRKK